MDGLKTDLNQLVIFAKVVETRSFTAAGRALGLPKSTVSRKVAQLEERIGARLLQRTTRRIELTESGAAFHEHCVRITADIAEAERAVGREHGRPHGLLRVAVSRELGTRFFGELVGAYLAEQPEVDLELHLGGRSLDPRGEGVDLVLDSEGRREPGVVARPLACLRRCTLARPSYLAMAERTSQPHAWVVGRGQGFAVARPRVIVDDLGLVRDALLAGLGVGVLPIHECQAELDSGALVELEGEAREAMAVYAMYPTSRQLSTKVRSFVEFVQRRLAQFGELPELAAVDADASDVDVSDADVSDSDGEADSDAESESDSDELGAGLYSGQSSGASATQP